MIENRSRGVPRKIEIRVICEIQDGFFVGGRMIINLELALAGQRVADRNIQISRVVFFAIRTEISLGDCHSVQNPDCLLRFRLTEIACQFTRQRHH